MIIVTSTIIIPDAELTLNYVRASGPGGQNVNKVSTVAQLRFNVRASTSLSEEVKGRLANLAGNKMTKEGLLVIEAKRYRSQEQNRIDAEKRLSILINKALISPKSRKQTHPTEASLARRLETKKIRAELKRQRRIISD